MAIDPRTFADETTIPGAKAYIANMVAEAFVRNRESYGSGWPLFGKAAAEAEKIQNDPIQWVANNVSWNNLSTADQQIEYLKQNNYDIKNLDQGQLNTYNLTKQILGQGLTGKWTGEGFGGAEANARAMASMLAGAGITDIKQFGQLPDGQYGNKVTGQSIDPNYSRAGGNIWGGTFAGEDSTGFGVQFGPDGTPYFYTQQGASTSDMGSIMPIVSLGLAIFAPGIGSAIGTALGATGTAATVIGGSIVQGVLAEASGGEFLDGAIKGAVMAGVAPTVASTVGSSVASSMGDSVFRDIVANSIASGSASAVAAAMTGGDVESALLTGAAIGAASPIGNLAGGTVMEAMGDSAIKGIVGSAVAQATSAAVAAEVLNKDVGNAALTGLVGGAAGQIGRELGTALNYGTDPLSQQNQMLMAQERGLGTSGTVGENLGVAAGNIALGADPAFALVNAAIKTSADMAKSETTPISVSQTGQTSTEEQKQEEPVAVPQAQTEAEVGSLANAPLLTEKPDALIPDESNTNLESGKTPQQRADEEWQRYLEGLGTKPVDLNLPGSTIDAGEYWDEYNQNLQRIMEEGGYTSQWQKANGDRVFISDDGTGIGISENGETYALSDTEVKEMVESGLLNTAESGYVAATTGENISPDGADQCGEGYHFDEARQICVPDSDEEQDDGCPEGYIRNLNTGQCIPVTTVTGSRTGSSVVSGGGSGGGSSLLGGAGLMPSLLSPFLMPEPPIVTSPSISDDPVMKGALPEVAQDTKFKGPLEEFMKMAASSSFTPKPPQPQPVQQQAGFMNDRLSYPQGGSDYFSYGQQSDIENNLGAQLAQPPVEPPVEGALSFKHGGMAAPLMAGGGMTGYGQYAGGGLNVINHSGKQRLDFRKGAAVSGPGDGQSDDIPAMLADGEFVFPADVVAALGNGSTKAGSDKLYEMMHSIRAHHRSAKPKDLPPPAKKSPLDYLKKAKKARS